MLFCYPGAAGVPAGNWPGPPLPERHIGKCMAVCSGKISRENYEQAVKSAVHLIRYGKKDILKTLNERMLEASDRLEFETAALIRDQIAAITKVTAGRRSWLTPTWRWTW